MATEASKRMGQIVAGVAPVLKRAGFRKRRYGFNRTLDSGLTHVVHFQMGAYMPPGSVEIPGLRENLHGRFTINLGVFAAVMHVDVADPPARWINEYDCQMHWRIGTLLPAGEDVWWSIEDPASADLALLSLEEVALPWLDRFPSLDAIREAYEELGPQALGFPPRGPMHIAAIELAAGDRDAAARRLREYLAGPMNPSHRPFVLEYARRHGLTEIADPH